MKEQKLQILIIPPHEENELLPLTNALMLVNKTMEITTKRYNELVGLIKTTEDLSTENLSYIDEIACIHIDIYQTHQLLLKLYPEYTNQITNTVKNVKKWLEKEKNGN